MKKKEPNTIKENRIFDPELTVENKYKSIQNLTQILIEKTSIQGVANEIVDKAIYSLGFEDCSFYILNENQLELVSFHSSHQAFSDKLKFIRTIGVEKGIITDVATSGKPIIASNTSNGDKKSVFNSQITVPILYNKKVIGVIDSEHEDKDHFTKEHLETLETIANIASVKIIQIKRNQELELYKSELEQLVNKRTEDLENILKELQKKNTEIRRQNKSLNLLLQEVHHRVANNLQIILSLIRIKYLNTGREVHPNQFKELENRILSMSLIHQNIMNKGFISKDDFSTYLSDLVRHIQSSEGFSKNISLVKRLDTFSIHPNDMFYLGLIITEILANSIKHGFDQVEIPTITFEITKDDQYNILKIEDNGSGFDLKLWENSAPTSGFDVIKILTEQIDGVIQCQNSPNTIFTIHIPFS
ncbi:MAG: GAF domain-containing protein [Crocinitomicaceae bacterium]|nr:GAF domain-containing protein [Crocinitomicaceae bacterium]